MSPSVFQNRQTAATLLEKRLWPLTAREAGHVHAPFLPSTWRRGRPTPWPCGKMLLIKLTGHCAWSCVGVRAHKTTHHATRCEQRCSATNPYAGSQSRTSPARSACYFVITMRSTPSFFSLLSLRFSGHTHHPTPQVGTQEVRCPSSRGRVGPSACSEILFWPRARTSDQRL